MKWQHYELWSGTVNLSSLAIINEDKDDDDDDPNKPSPFVLVKCHSPDMVGTFISYFFTFAVFMETPLSCMLTFYRHC